jgi:cobalt/nickel transport system ATP-binding protein
VMADGNVVGSGAPREVFYDDALLAEANLHPPSAVRIAHEAGLDTPTRPVCEADLVGLITGSEESSNPIENASPD